MLAAAAFPATSTRNEQLRRAADTPESGREKFRAVPAFYVDSAQGAEGRRGCLIVGTATELATMDPEIAARVTGSLRKNEAFLADLIKADQGDGSISPHVDRQATAPLLPSRT